MIFNDYEPTLCTIFRLPSSIYLMDIVLYRFAIAHYLITLYHEKDKEFMAETIKHVFILQRNNHVKPKYSQSADKKIKDVRKQRNSKNF